MDNQKSLIQLNVTYSIAEEKLKTNVNYPIEFIRLEYVEQVSLLGSLIELLNKTEVPDFPEGMLDLTQAHDSLVTEGVQLFPFCSIIELDLTNKEQAVGVKFTHDKSVATIHPMHAAVLVDSIIKVLSAMAIMVVRRSEGESK